MSILSKIEYRSKEDLFEAILEKYFSEWSVIVSFLYFTNLMKWRLLEGTPELWQRRYLHALQQSDFLLADGIALQMFTKWSWLWKSKDLSPPNLNWTDFNPYFLDGIIQNHEAVNICLLMFWDKNIGKWEHYAQIAEEKFSERFWSELNYVWQTEYKNKDVFEFDRNEYAKTLHDDNEIRILFVCLWTPTQEIRVEKNKHKIQEYGILVLNAWWTIDYITWFEQRAPERVVKARVLETFWRISAHPKKNIKKFLAMFGIIRYRCYWLKKKILK